MADQGCILVVSSPVRQGGIGWAAYLGPTQRAMAGAAMLSPVGIAKTAVVLAQRGKLHPSRSLKKTFETHEILKNLIRLFAMY